MTIEQLRSLHNEPHDGLTEGDVDELFAHIDAQAAEIARLRQQVERLGIALDRSSSIIENLRQALAGAADYIAALPGSEKVEPYERMQAALKSAIELTQQSALAADGERGL